MRRRPGSWCRGSAENDTTRFCDRFWSTRPGSLPLPGDFYAAGLFWEGTDGSPGHGHGAVTPALLQRPR
jgi:hypothetical protein